MLPPFDCQISRQRRMYIVAVALVAALSILGAGLAWFWQLALLLIVLTACCWQWSESLPARIQWRDQLLWLDEAPYQVLAASSSIWPCWVLLLENAQSQQRRYWLLWPDSLAADALRQLRVAIATRSD